MAITTSYRTRSDAVPLRSFKAKGRPSAIAGVGVHAPEKVITNFDLEKMMDTSDKWITERTGLRRVPRPERARRAGCGGVGHARSLHKLCVRALHRRLVHRLRARRHGARDR